MDLIPVMNTCILFLLISYVLLYLSHQDFIEMYGLDYEIPMMGKITYAPTLTILKLWRKMLKHGLTKISANFLVKSHGLRSYYLGNDYIYHDVEDMCTYGCHTYVKEAIAKVERMFGTLTKESTPMPVDDCHPELDASSLLGLNDICIFQMVLRML